MKRLLRTGAGIRIPIPEQKLQEAMSLSPGKTRPEVERALSKELGKRMKGILLLSLLLLAAALLLPKEEGSDRLVLKRPAAGEGVLSVRLLVQGEKDWQETVLAVGALEYEEAEIERLHEEAARYLDEAVPGENESFSLVEKSLYFPEEVNGFEISWSTDALWLVDNKGEVHNEELAESDSVTITGKIFYGEEFRVYERQITVVKKSYTEEEQLLKEIERQLSVLETESRTEQEITLPGELLGRQIREAAEESVPAGGFLLLLAVVLPPLVYQNYFGSLRDRRKKREEQAKRGYPEFITKLSLMLVAGVSVRQAFGRLAEEYKKNYGEDYVLTQELNVAWQELKNGHSEQEVYEAFGNRVGVLCYQRMASLLTQNATKGVQGIRGLLLTESKEVMATERAEIRVRGEQAGTKLILPMMGFLILVFAILLVPAFQMF